MKNFDRLSDTLCAVIDAAELVRHAHPDPDWAEAANEAYEMLCSYMNVLNTHTELYEVRSHHINPKPYGVPSTCSYKFLISLHS